MRNFSTTTTAMLLSALLLLSAASPAAAAQMRSTKTFSQAVINQALKARDASRPGDDLDECMKQNEGNEDYIGTLGGCFCLTTDSHSPGCGEEYEPED
jgi:hypothetical protein